MSASRSSTNHRYRFADLIVSSDRPLLELPPSSDVLDAVDTVEADVTITHGDLDAPADVRWFQTWTAGGSGVRFGRTSTGYLVSFPDLADVAVSADARRVRIARTPGTTDFALRHVLLHQVLPLVANRLGRCVLHASAVSWRDRILAFAGRTGSGKSTMAAACAAAGGSLVTDDSLVLVRSTGVWRGIPSYPGIRVKPASLPLVGVAETTDDEPLREDEKVLLTAGQALAPFETRVLPLGGVYVVSIGDTDRITPMKGSPAVIALASQLFRLDVEDAAESTRLFDAVTSVASSVPVCMLQVARGADVRPFARRLMAAC